MNHKDFPLGYGFTLAQNPDTMQKISCRTDSQQSEILQKAHDTVSKGEMQFLVNPLASDIDHIQ